MEFRILGPLEVGDDAGVIALGGPLPRALLALLLLHANQPVSVDRLTVALWGDDAPAGSGRTLQVYVSRLRKALGERDRLIITPAGYLVRVLPDELDAARFERRVADGLGALEMGELDRAASVLRDALSMWRGPALAELASVWLAPSELARLEERRLVAIEARVEAELGLGRHGVLIAELQGHIAEHPWRERLHAQLMVALYRAGRQADALEAYRHAREALVEQLGIEPGRELQDLHRAVLAQDTELDAPDAGRGAVAGRGLPALPNRTIGREHELAALGEQLRRARLVTLVGPGGVGKTRLALEVAHRVRTDFSDGAHFVALAAVERSDDVPAAFVDALGLTVLAGESSEQAVGRFLPGKHVLLVADNCEHVLDAAPFIGELLERCPGLLVLATSREPLALRAEQRYPVSPLAEAAAVALFDERARAHDPAFALADGNQDAVAEICRRLDGLPLAIELASARCGLLSAREIAERLDSALGAPAARDTPARQRTLRAAIEWSYELLNEPERACFARFAVFAGGATIEAAETITAGSLDTLDGLVTKSLLTRSRHGNAPTRVGMLETIRGYAAERFAYAVDAEAVREEHFRYFLALARRRGTQRALRGEGAREHFERLDAEIDNLHAALGWAIARGSAERALEMAAALGGYWLMRSRSDALDWIELALNVPGGDADPVRRARVLYAKSRCLWFVGRGAERSAVVAEAEAVARRCREPVLLSQVLQSRAGRETDAERLDAADALADEALHWARVARDDWEIALAAREKAMAASSIAELRERVDAAASLLADVGNIHELAMLLSSASFAALCLGSENEAADFAARAEPITRALDLPYLWMIQNGNRGLAALLTGETDTASNAFREELTICRELVVRPIAWEGLRGLAAVAVVNGEHRRAATLVGAADAHRYDQPEDLLDARLEAAFFQPARIHHGTDAWDAAVCDGRELSFEDAIAYALQDPAPTARAR